MAKKRGNLVKRVGAYTQPIVNLTGANNLPRPGQFANQIKPVVSYTGANNVAKPSVVAQPGQFSIVQYMGANQVQAPRQASIKVQAVPVRQPVIVGSAGVSPAPATQADGQLGGQFGNNPVARALTGGVGGAILNELGLRQPVQQFLNYAQRQTQKVDLAPVNRGQPTAALTGANNARYVNQNAYTPGVTYGPPTPPNYRGQIEQAGAQTQAELVRRRQITQLTAPYQGSVAALTGANMVEPANVGFPGTDPRQPIPRAVSPSPTNLFSDVYGASEEAKKSSGGGRKYGYGGGGGYYSGGSGYDYVPRTYTQTAYGQVLNWRVATG